MRLINADEIKEWIENWFTKNRYYHPYAKGNNIPITELYDILEQIPTVDAVPVIRCKDCKYNVNNPVPFYDDDPIMTYAWCNTECFDENGFCSCGKRIEE